jgi:hypothetical protein
MNVIYSDMELPTVKYNSIVNDNNNNKGYILKTLADFNKMLSA